MEGEAYLDIVWKQFKKNSPAYISLWVLGPLLLVAIFAPLIASEKPLAFYDKLGIRWDSMDENEDGVRLTNVHPDSAMARAGLQSGDRILKLAGTQIRREGSETKSQRLEESLLRARGDVSAVVQKRAQTKPAPVQLSLADEPVYIVYPWFNALFNPPEMVDYFFNMALLAFCPWLVIAVITNWKAKRSNIPGRRRIGWTILEYILLVAIFSTVFWFDEFKPDNRYSTRTFVAEEFESSHTRQGWYVPIPFGPTEQDGDSLYEKPGYRKPKKLWTESNDGFVHLLGTDGTGRDVLTRLIYGTRISMTVGFVAVGIYVTIGVILGALAGFYGGALDALISRVIEVVLLFPSFFLILTLVAMFGRSIFIIMVVIGITSWPTIARLTRGEVLKQRALDYTMAAQALGSSNLRIVFRHILPNALTPALVAAPFGIAGAIVTEAGLSLLGFGVAPPAPSWGSLLYEGNANYSYWWMIVVPSIAIFITVTVFNLVGSGLRDAMDPRLRM